ncbi:ABC transporter substrate-binding protein [Pseudonocardia sp. RS010]|uniref:ABC transporter substrate-binding protein n=1 Tax=Pseudonocardia sp. RS010 TaxID=3385979 RepID=UPI0039A0D3A8
MAVAACSGSAPSDAKDHAASIRIDTTVMTSPAYVGRLDKAFESAFQKRGVAVEYAQLNTSPQMLEALASNSVDIVELGYVGVITGAASRVKFTLVGQASNGGGDQILVPENSPVRSVEDLRGRTVATAKGSSGWALLLRSLAAANMTKDDVRIVNLQPDEAQNAFLSGQIDAWAVWAGSVSPNAVSDANSTVITTGAAAGLVPGLVAVRTAFLDENPGLVQEYLATRAAVLADMTTEHATVTAQIAEGRKVSPGLVEHFFTLSSPVQTEIADDTIKRLQGVADLLLSEGEITSRPELSDLVDNTAVNAAAK